MGKKVINSLNAGQWSPLMVGRYDLDKYNSACQELRNMIVLPQGGVTERPGTKYIATTKNSGKVRLENFVFSVSQAYILEIGEKYIRFYRNGGQLVDGSDDPIEVVTTYLEADLFELQFHQSADVLYITHNEYAPSKLERTSDTSWTFSTTTFKNGPFRMRNDLLNDDDITMTAASPAWVTSTAYTVGMAVIESATNYKCIVAHTSGTFATDLAAGKWETSSEVGVDTAGITLTASDDVFDDDHVGALFQLTHKREDNLSGVFTSTGQSSSILVNGKFDFTTDDTWKGTVVLQKNVDGAGWEGVRTWVSYNSTNIQFSDEELEDNVLYRINCTVYTSGNIRYNLSVRDGLRSGNVLITAVNSATEAEGTVQRTLVSTDATKRWAEGAWSAYRGYSSTGTFFEERHVFAGSPTDLGTIWMSKTYELENFREGPYANDAITRAISADQVNTIKWIVAQKALMVGTEGDLWRAGATNFEEAVTPENFMTERIATETCNIIRGMLVNRAVLFFDQHDRVLRELAFVFDGAADGFKTPDLTELSSNITESGIVQVALQRSPNRILWCVRDDGILIGLTYERDQNVVSWHPHELGGTDAKVESAAVIPGNGEDEIWLSTSRTINGSTVRHIGQMQPRDFGNQEDAWFVDSGLSYSGSETDTFSGLDHLEGETVSVWSDGYVQADVVVSGGSVTISQAATDVIVGLSYRALIKPMKFIMENQYGISAGDSQRIREVQVSTYKTLNAKYGPDEDNLTDIVFDTHEPPELFTGTKTQSFPSNFSKDAEMVIVQDSPAPMTITHIIAKI